MPRLTRYWLLIILNTLISQRLTYSDLSHTLEENIMSCGAMDVLISDNAHAATSQEVKDVLCMYRIQSCTSELHHNTKTILNAVLGISKMSQIMFSPLLVSPVVSGYYASCMQHIFLISPNNSDGNISPHQYLYGRTPEIS